MDNQQVKQCVLMQHGLSVMGRRLGKCCYNLSGSPIASQGYDIDPVGCKTCVDQEANNVFSYRQGANQKYGFDHSPGSILVLDFTPNINCNLACKICNEAVSSNWAKIKKIKINQSTSVNVDEFKQLVDKYDLSTVREINMSGGEPWLNSNIVRYISMLEHRVDFSKVTLRFSSNGTHRLNKKLQDFFEKFQLVLARFSLDDVEQHHDYQRWPSHWDEWQSNWVYFLENHPHNVIPSINRTVSLLNIARLDQLDQWAEKYTTTRYQDRIELIDHFAFGMYGLQNLSDRHKQYILKSQGPQSRAWGYVKNRPTVNNSDLKNFVAEQDRLHSTDLESVDPELYSILCT